MEEKTTHQEPNDSRSALKKLLLKSAIALALGVPLFVVTMMGLTHVDAGVAQIIWIIIGLIVGLIMWYSGGHFFSAAWTSFKAHKANMNTLIALATGPAWVYSMIVAISPGLFPDLGREVFFDAPLTVIGLLVLGAAIEMHIGEKAGRTVNALQRLVPKQVMLVKKNNTTVDLNDVVVDDHIQVQPGEIIPVDGKIIEGTSQIDDSTLTGVSQPTPKNSNDLVYAGSKNVGAMITIVAVKSSAESSLSKIVALVKKAQNTKPAISAIADKIAGVFAPIVLIAAFITLAIWMNFGPSPRVAYMLVTFMAVLLIACPCALGLAAPISSSVGIAKATQSGALLKNSDVFSRLPKTEILVLTDFYPDTMAVVKALAKYGIRTILLAGEKSSLSHNIDTQLFEYYATDVSVEDKNNKINELEKTGNKIAVITDAAHFSELSLKDETVKIAMGMESHQIKAVDIAILRNSLFGFLEVYQISRATLRNIKQNLSGAFIYNTVGIPIAAGVFYPLVHTLLNPIIAGALMATSSIAVILNANRLQLFKASKRSEA